MGTEVINNITHNYRGQPETLPTVSQKPVKPLYSKEKPLCSFFRQASANSAKPGIEAGTTSLSTTIPTALVENFIFVAWHAECLAK